MDGAIEERWRLLMDDFAKGYIGTLKAGVEDIFGAPSRPGSISPLLAKENPSWQRDMHSLSFLDGRLEQLEYIKVLTSTFAVGFRKPETVDSSDISQSVLECVERQRGGSSTHFNFVLPAVRVNQPQVAEVSPASSRNSFEHAHAYMSAHAFSGIPKQTQSKPVIKQAG
eukprot:515309-Pelagomonas_calceolata.AAC.1